MKSKTYLIVCIAVAAVVSLSILYVPGVAQTIEQSVLAFLATNAR